MQRKPFGIALPDFNAGKFFALWQLMRSGEPNRLERDEYGAQLMAFVAQRFAKRSWWASLAKDRIEPEDAAGYLTEQLYRKSMRLILQHPCPLVLCKVLVVALERDFISLIRHYQRKSNFHIDQFPETGNIGCTASGAPAPERLRAALRASVGIDDERLARLRNSIIDSIVEGRGAPTYRELPADIRREVSADEHARAMYQTNRALPAIVADVAASSF